MKSAKAVAYLKSHSSLLGCDAKEAFEALKKAGIYSGYTSYARSSKNVSRLLRTARNEADKDWRRSLSYDVEFVEYIIQLAAQIACDDVRDFSGTELPENLSIQVYESVLGGCRDYLRQRGDNTKMGDYRTVAQIRAVRARGERARQRLIKAYPPEKHAVGDVVTYNNRQFRVTSVDKEGRAVGIEALNPGQLGSGNLTYPLVLPIQGPVLRHEDR